MHIPSSMLNGGICPVTLAVGGLGAAGALYVAHRQEEFPAGRWLAVTGLIFVLQMINFPIYTGMSGHFLGSALAFLLLGVPGAILSMAAVVTAQAFFLGDGGLTALGANIFNMAVIGVGTAYLFIADRKTPSLINLVMASVMSVVAASLACAVTVSAAGVASPGAMVKLMLPVHLLIGLTEAVLTIALWHVFSASKTAEQSLAWRAALVCAAALALLPLASHFPDGLEWSLMQAAAH